MKVLKIIIILCVTLLISMTAGARIITLQITGTCGIPLPGADGGYGLWEADTAGYAQTLEPLNASGTAQFDDRSNLPFSIYIHLNQNTVAWCDYAYPGELRTSKNYECNAFFNTIKTRFMNQTDTILEIPAGTSDQNVNWSLAPCPPNPP